MTFTLELILHHESCGILGTRQKSQNFHWGFIKYFILKRCRLVGLIKLVNLILNIFYRVSHDVLK